MDEWNIKITWMGWFTCDAYYFDYDDNMIPCPEFETIEELVEWVKQNEN